MVQDSHTTDMMFRVTTTSDFKGEVFALMPHDCADNKGNVVSYAHIGQHSAADYNHCISRSRPATEKEYADLKRELENIGYNIRVVQRRNYNKYLESYRKR